MMFTGIIKQLGTVESLERKGEGGVLSVRCDGWQRPWEIGESISTQGVCLTLARREGDRLEFDLLAETLDRTNLGEKQSGDLLNLERALLAGDALGGHIVQGHIDGAGQVTDLEEVGADWIVDISCSQALLADMVFNET